jgi:hypothetical protein
VCSKTQKNAKRARRSKAAQSALTQEHKRESNNKQTDRHEKMSTPSLRQRSGKAGQQQGSSGAGDDAKDQSAAAAAAAAQHSTRAQPRRRNGGGGGGVVSAPADGVLRNALVRYLTTVALAALFWLAVQHMFRSAGQGLF